MKFIFAAGVCFVGFSVCLLYATSHLQAALDGWRPAPERVQHVRWYVAWSLLGGLAIAAALLGILTAFITINAPPAVTETF